MENKFNRDYIEMLAFKAKNGTLSDEEWAIFNTWYAAHNDEFTNLPEGAGTIDSIRANMLHQIQKDIYYKPQKFNMRVLTGIAAAIVLTVFCIWFYQRKDPIPQKSIGNDTAMEISPGKQGATLTLANGKKIRLSDAANGELAKEAGLVITKSANGQLVYEIQEGIAEQNKINTLTTSRGETYEVRLPDGTLVWLNAASSLSYATKPNEKGERRVKLYGEGYFEVAKDKSHPFIVETRGHAVEVLGTRFNISSYSDDAMEQTTLIEGSIRLNKDGNIRVLKPGQQASIKGAGIRIEEVDTDQAIAWKNNEFMFQSESIESVMKAVERWYNVEVIYVGDRTKERFTGGVSRFDNVSKVLNIVESTGASHFKIRGRKIYVSKLPISQ